MVSVSPHPSAQEEVPDRDDYLGNGIPDDRLSVRSSGLAVRVRSSYEASIAILEGATLIGHRSTLDRATTTEEVHWCNFTRLKASTFSENPTTRLRGVGAVERANSRRGRHSGAVLGAGDKGTAVVRAHVRTEQPTRAVTDGKEKGDNLAYAIYIPEQLRTAFSCVAGIRVRLLRASVVTAVQVAIRAPGSPRVNKRIEGAMLEEGKPGLASTVPRIVIARHPIGGAGIGLA